MDNPNLYSSDPQYILKLVLSIIDISVKTREIIESLPEIGE